MAAAKDVFERLGWSGTTMRAVASEAGVSVKTVEARYRTKAELLKLVVDYAIAGDLRDVPVIGRDSVAAMKAAPDAPTMLVLHARHTRDINGRAAQVFWVVEQAASDGSDMAALWAQTCENRKNGARFVAMDLMGKPGLAPHVTQGYAEDVLWWAIDPGTYRSLVLGRGFSLDEFEAWLRNYYEKMLLLAVLVLAVLVLAVLVLAVLDRGRGEPTRSACLVVKSRCGCSARPGSGWPGRAGRGRSARGFA